MKKSTNSYKIAAVVFAIFLLGALSETHRIFMSSSPDIVESRRTLMFMSVAFTSVILGVTVWFWRKSRN
jgi:hypothetical protein